MSDADQSPAIRVVSIDDYPDMHELIADWLEPEPDLRLVGSAEDGDAGLRLVDELLPDVLILDVRLPALGGLTVAERVRAEHPAVAILAWTGHDDIASYRRLMELDVPGYLHKPVRGDNLIAAVRLLASGGRVIEKDPIVAAAEHGIEPLTEAEWRVLRLMADDRTNAEIAKARGIAPSTAEAYVGRVLRKLGVKARAGAVARGYDYGPAAPARRGQDGRSHLNAGRIAPLPRPLGPVADGAGRRPWGIPRARVGESLSEVRAILTSHGAHRPLAWAVEVPNRFGAGGGAAGVVGTTRARACRARLGGS